jgi:thiol-disulfide isomerase/thioredoxin
VKIEGVIEGDTSLQLAKIRISVFLVPYLEDGQYYSTQVNADGTFSIKIPVYEPVLYDLKYRGMKMDALLCPDETEFKVLITADGKEVKNMKNIGSHQYEAYRAFKHAISDMGDKLHTMLNCGEDKNCIAQAKKDVSDLNDRLTLVEKSFPGTFTASAIVPVAYLPEIDVHVPLRNQLQEHFFDAVPWKDARIFSMPELDGKLSAYLELVAENSAAGRVAFIENMWKRAAGDKTIGKNILSLLIHNFTDNNREAYLLSLVEWANKTAGLAAEQPVMESKIRLIAKTIPGATASEVVGQDTGGRKHALSAMTKASKLTLLIFWSSDCGHCRHSIPEFERLYKQYHAQGLDIFGASLDESESKWKEFVEKNKLPWLNVLLPPEATAHSDYYIQYTPTLVLIDNQATIIHRFMSTENLDKMIGDFLKK